MEPREGGAPKDQNRLAERRRLRRGAPSGVLPGLEKAGERRAMPSSEPRRRRRRDRLDPEGRLIESPVVREIPALRGPLLLCDDDLRQTAQAIEGIEAFVLMALATLERPDLNRDHLLPLVADQAIGEKIDVLGDALAGLRKRLALIHAQLR